MSDLSTKPNEASVEEFLNAVENEQKRNDSFSVLDLMRADNRRKTGDVGWQHRRFWHVSL